MADKNKKMTDVDLSKKLSFAIYENYRIALEFIETNPDYSLLKFRNIIDSVVYVIADEKNIEFEDTNLNDNIRYLHECRISSKPLDDNLHEIKKLCNDGIHNGSSFNDEEEFDKVKNELTKKAKIARKKIVEIFEEVYFITIKKQSASKITKVAIGHNRYIIYNALISTDYKEKLKAGIACEAMFKELFYSSETFVSNDVMYNFGEIQKITLAFYEATYKMSVQVDSKAFLSETEEEILQRCDIEPLYKYANLGLSFVNNKDKKFKNALQAAADRDYIPAKALLGHALYEEGKFKLAFKYLLSVKDTNECIALLQLYYCYTEGEACESNPNKALKYLKKAVKLKYPNALATLSIVYYHGKYLRKDYKKSQELLEESIALGSSLGEKFKERIEKEESSPKQEPVKVIKETGRNEKCPCGSGKKYKKCHGKSK